MKVESRISDFNAIRWQEYPTILTGSNTSINRISPSTIFFSNVISDRHSTNEELSMARSIFRYLLTLPDETFPSFLLLLPREFGRSINFPTLIGKISNNLGLVSNR